MNKLSHTRASALLLALLLAGCATSATFEQGVALAEAGHPEEALAQYRAALAEDPRNAEYRIAYLNTRDKLIAGWLADAAEARRNGRNGEAVALYKKAQQLDPNEPRVREGLRGVERENRHGQLLAEAESALRTGDLDTASGRVRTVLGENPSNETALTYKREIDLRRSQPRAAADARLAAAFRKPISIEFRDAQLRQIFEVLSRASGLNFVLDKDVRGDQRTTIFLRNSTIADALQLTLLTNQLEQRVLDASSVLIYPNTAAKAHDYQPLSVKTITLNNADAKSVASTLRTILKSKDVVVLDRQNSIIMRDTPEAIRMAERIAALHDQPEPEVMLEVEVLEVQRNRLLNLGVQYPSQVSLAPIPTTAGGDLTLHDLLHLSSESLKAAVDPVTISATHNVGDVRVLANPRIRVINREKAQVLVGQRVPTVTTTTTSTGFAANSVQYLDVGLKLNVEPTVSADGEVTIRLSLEVSNVTNTSKLNDGTTTYELGTRSASTLLRLHDGENQVLAGLINDTQNSSSNRIPGLGDVPVVGRLFGSQSDTNNQSEIVLSITPRILRPAVRPDAVDSEFDSGTEGSLRALTTGGVDPVYGAPPPPPPQQDAAPQAPAPQQSTPQATPPANSQPAPLPTVPTQPMSAPSGKSASSASAATQELLADA
jgi:general secretion pathway protein D